MSAFLLGSTDSSLWALAIVKFKARTCGFDGDLVHPEEQVLNGDVGFHLLGEGGMSLALRAVKWSCFGVSG
jgi:hypothetical protein